MSIYIIYEKNETEKVKMAVSNKNLASLICSSLNQDNYITKYYFVEYPIIDSDENINQKNEKNCHKEGRGHGIGLYSGECIDCDN